MRPASVFSRPPFRRLLLGLTAPLLLSSCVPSGKPTAPPYQPPSKPASRPAPPSAEMSSQEKAEYQRQVLEPALATISGRIASYEQKLREWQELGSRKETLSLSPDEIELIVSCRNRVADLQEAYKNLQEQLLQERPPSASRELLFSSLSRFKENDISYLEGECPKLQADLSSMSGPRDSGTAAEQGESSQLTAAPPEAVIEEPPPAAAPEQDSASLQQQGQVLLKNGHEQEARSLFASLLTAARREGNRQQEIRALQMLADLDFGFREYASARRKYSELRRLDSGSSVRCGRHIRVLEAASSRRDELDAYASLLLGCLTYNPDEDGFTVVQQTAEFLRLFPESPLAEDAEEWSRRVEREAEQWFSVLLTAAEQLEPAAALARLERVPLDILPLDKQDQLRQKKEQLRATAPAAAAQTEPAVPVQEPPVQQLPASQASPLPDPAAALQETWDKGLAAMQAEDYDQAIALFAQLRHTSYNDRAEGKIEEAERLAGESVRKKAAALFQQAVSAADPDMKKTLLLSSKSLLEDILRKYPRAGIEAKIRKNLSSVDRELAAAGSGGRQ
ncbi:MAG: hypothetical protein ACTFAL_09315 [Candidatus Electronema sp. V4]|uniref:hypothetical protein n=1 Tax=Candidatus Electronema sp. V4 TaxID=3454756 RepID=UPI00405555E3